MPLQPRASSAVAKAMVCSMSQPPGAQSVPDTRIVTGRSCGERRAHGVEHFQREPHPVLEAAAVVVVALVRQRREELVQQIAVRAVQLHGVEAEPARRAAAAAANASRIPARPRGRAPTGGCSPSANGTGDGATVCQPPGCSGGSARRPSHGTLSTPCARRGRAGWRSACPTSAGRSRASGRAPARCRRTRGRGRAARCAPRAHGGRFDGQQRRAGECQVAEVDDVPVGRAALVGRVLAHGRDHDPVAQLEAADAERGEQTRLAHAVAAYRHRAPLIRRGGRAVERLERRRRRMGVSGGAQRDCTPTADPQRPCWIDELLL